MIRVGDCFYIFIVYLFLTTTCLEEEVKEIADEEDWQFVTIGDQVNQIRN
jgi:hypothetical protein